MIRIITETYLEYECPDCAAYIPQTGADFGALPVILLLLAAGVMLVVAGWRR